MYPSFTVESIQQRCTHDITHFVTEFNLTIQVDPLGVTPTSAKKRITHVLKELKQLGIHSYVHDIKKSHDHHTAWILRTQLFYQLLLFATLTLQNKSLYDKTYKDCPFRSDVPPMLSYFKMGIFGSITPTSDIDVGVHYSGPPIKPALAYIVSRFETLFLICTGKPSIDFDIETYADMMTIPNPIPDHLHPDYFYLDTTGFTEVEYKRMLPIAANSILRNAYFISPDTVNTVTMADILKSFKLSYMPDFLDVSRKKVFDFMNGSYEEGRQMYYKKVEIAERIQQEKLRGPMTPSDICDIMVAIGDALTYRYESYTCSPTVIHVVRILQAAREKAEKYRTLVPKTYCKGDIVHLDPFCTIGKYGYALSMLEQLGYLYRFYKIYCMGDHPEYCKKKVDKYWKRYKDAKFYKKKYERKTRRQ